MRRTARACACSTSPSPGPAATSCCTGRRARPAPGPHRCIACSAPGVPGRPVAAAGYPVRRTAGRGGGAARRGSWSSGWTSHRRGRGGRRRQVTGRTLHAAPFTRTLDTTWRRTSYTGLTAAAHGPERAPAGFRDDEPEGPAAAPGSQPATGRHPRREPPDGGRSGATPAATGPQDDEPSALVHVAPGPRSASPDALERRSPFADLPAGAAFGTLVHGILETIDTASADLLAEVRATDGRRAVGPSDARGGRPRPSPPPSSPPCAHRSARSPAGCRLADIPPGDRLAELDFELPMGGATRRHAWPTLAALVRQHARRRRPAVRLPRPPRRPRAGHLDPARLPEREHRRGAAGARAAGPPLPGRRLQDEPASRPRRTGRRAAGLGISPRSSCPRR